MINILRTFHSIPFHPPQRNNQYTLNLRGNRAEQSEWSEAERNETSGDARSVTRDLFM